MEEKTHFTLNRPDLIKIRDKYFKRLSNLYAGNNTEVFFLNGIYGRPQVDLYKEPEKAVEEALDDLASKANTICGDIVFRPLCFEFGIYGVHFIDKILGCNVYYNKEYGQWYNDYLEIPIGQLEYPNLDIDETWQLARRIAKTFLDADVSLPLFGLPTIASAVNIALNLYGQNILIAMHTDPEKARHSLKIINTLLCEIHEWYRNNIPFQQLQPVISTHRTQPPGYGQLCGCSNQLISPEDYKEFFAPLDEELLSVYPNGGMIHLCGSHTQHIPTWREMKVFKAFQLNDRAAEDLERYFNELKNDQIIYLNPCDNMTVKRALDITGGQRLVIAEKSD